MHLVSKDVGGTVFTFEGTNIPEHLLLYIIAKQIKAESTPAESLKLLRTTFGYTQQQLADKVGITKQQISAMERGGEGTDRSQDGPQARKRPRNELQEFVLVICLTIFPDAGKMVAFLRKNCYRSPVFYDIVNFFDFVVGDGDATGRPILPFVPKFKEECWNLVRVAVDHDVSAWLVVTFFRCLDLLCVRVRNFQR